MLRDSIARRLEQFSSILAVASGLAFHDYKCHWQHRPRTF